MGLRASAVYASIVLAWIVIALAVTPYQAWGAAAELKYEVISGGVTYGNDIILTGLRHAVYHDHALNASDSEDFDMSFPGGYDFSPSQGTGIALPSISQTSAQTISESATGFYFANYPYCPFCNNGAAGVGVGQFGQASPVVAAGFDSNALMYPEMVNQGILDPGLKYENNNLNNTMMTLPPALAADAYAETAAIGSQTVGETPRKNSLLENSTPPMILSEQRVNLNANASQINNMSIVERMWRDSHLAHLMDVAYEGTTSNPVWMEPLKPTEGLQRTNHSKVLRDAMNMTQPGKYIKKEFWDINPLVPGSLETPNQVPAVQGVRQATVTIPVGQATPSPGVSTGSRGSKTESLFSFFSSRPG